MYVAMEITFLFLCEGLVDKGFSGVSHRGLVSRHIIIQERACSSTIGGTLLSAVRSISVHGPMHFSAISLAMSENTSSLKYCTDR